MAGGVNLIKCKSCARALATVTPNGLTPVPSSEEFGCSTCQRFSTLYDSLQAADTEWAAFENKRDSITKSFARDNHKRARMEFDNWLMTVEELPVPRTGEHVTRIQDATPEVQDVFRGSEEPHLGNTRRRSHSPTTQPPAIAGQLCDQKLEQQCAASLSFRPSPKRSRSTSSLPSQKRLKFSDTVEFHETYRSSEEYHRPSELYVRGRNAPPEGSDYMDTSGSSQTFLRFTKMKKVGARWVELSEEDLAKKSKSPALTAAQQKTGAAEQVELHKSNGGAAGNPEQNREAPPDARATRLARRAKEAFSIDSAHTKGTNTQNRRSKIARKVNMSLLDGMSAGTHEPLIQPTLISSTPTADGTKLDTDEGMGAVKEVGLGHEERTEKANVTDIEKASIWAMRKDEMQKPDQFHGSMHLDVENSGTASDQGESIEGDIKATEIGLQSVVAQNHPQTDRTSITSCTGWENA
jgi:hypothetical protein